MGPGYRSIGHLVMRSKRIFDATFMDQNANQNANHQNARSGLRSGVHSGDPFQCIVNNFRHQQPPDEASWITAGSQRMCQ